MLWSRVRPPGVRHAATDTVRLIREAAAHPAAGKDDEDPVFVDATGRRGRRIRRVAYAAGALCAGYTVVLALSFMGATPFAPRTVLPVPGVPSEAPGSVGENPRDLPATPVPYPSVSPSDIPSPSPVPTESGQLSTPATKPAPSSTPGTGTPTDTGTPTGTPTDTATPTETGTPTPTDSTEETPSPSPETTATGSPGASEPAAADTTTGP
ncbi:hypothetical protein ABZ835_43840 [Streptomyces sp. NPDC047461]|uniref:hypothetical protein n=1 Tax=Streptomyces sp. NPDC047461 TaxID=3155619 RepID=UPI0033CAC9C9